MLSKADLMSSVSVNIQQLHKFETGVNHISVAKHYWYVQILNSGIENFLTGCRAPPPEKGSQDDIRRYKVVLIILSAMRHTCL